MSIATGLEVLLGSTPILHGGDVGVNICTTNDKKGAVLRLTMLSDTDDSPLKLIAYMETVELIELLGDIQEALGFLTAALLKREDDALTLYQNLKEVNDVSLEEEE